MGDLLFSFYGDDFTGSTDVMESLSLGGVETVLFTRIPTAAERGRFPHIRAIGIAGTSRSRPPGWMDENLPPVFAWLKQLGARFCHYKICSTFDSHPMVGSIGRAIEIGRQVFGQRLTPLVVGAPQLGRYTAFGHLFASYRGQVYRIDRHPVMSRHPVTPMDESDILVHLARQTALPMALVPASMLNPANDEAIARIAAAQEGVLLVDVLDRATQLEAGRQLLALRQATGPFVVGSSGVEYAVLAALAAEGGLPHKAGFAPLAPAGRLIAVSGSCSPTTARQIRHALEHGFTGIHADPLRLAGGDGAAYTQALCRQAMAGLEQGKSVIAYTALEPESDRSEALDAIADGRHRVGRALGRIARDCIRTMRLGRAIIAGGDSSSHALGELDVFALTIRWPLAATPGSPVCLAHSGDPGLDGIEIAMKGGQVGGDDYFTALLGGG